MEKRALDASKEDGDEHGYIVKYDCEDGGTEAIELFGNKKEIDIPENYLLSGSDYTVLMHTHPDNSPISIRDIDLFLYYDSIDEMTAVTEECRYVLLRKPNTKKPPAGLIGKMKDKAVRRWIKTQRRRFFGDAILLLGIELAKKYKFAYRIDPW